MILFRYGFCPEVWSATLRWFGCRSFFKPLLLQWASQHNWEITFKAPCFSWHSSATFEANRPNRPKPKERWKIMQKMRPLFIYLFIYVFIYLFIYGFIYFCMVRCHVREMRMNQRRDCCFLSNFCPLAIVSNQKINGPRGIYSPFCMFVLLVFIWSVIFLRVLD